MKHGRLQLKDIPDTAVLEAAVASWRARCAGGPPAPLTSDALIARFGNEKLVLRKIRTLTGRGLLEHGIDPRGAWPTRQAYKALQAAGLPYCT